MRVRACFLAAASPVFKALLSPRFHEGTELSASGTVEVALPDDDGEAMATICYVIHHQTSRMRTPCHEVELLSVAILSDKYGLDEVMKAHAQCWQTSHLDLLNGLVSSGEHDMKAQLRINRGFTYFLAAAYYFGDRAMLKTAGLNMTTEGLSVLGTKDSLFGRMVGEQVMDIFGKRDPLGILSNTLTYNAGEIAEERERLRTWTRDMIEVLVQRTLGIHDNWGGRTCASDCTYVEKRLWYLMDQLSSKNLWPTYQINSRTFDSLCAAVENMHLATDFDVDTECGNGCVARSAHNLGHNLDEFKRIVMAIRSPQILCYTCIRQQKGQLLQFSDSCEHE